MEPVNPEKKSSKMEPKKLFQDVQYPSDSKFSEFILSTPWGATPQPNNETRFRGEKFPDVFVTERSRLHALYIQETEKTKREVEKTKRLGLILSFLLTLSAGGAILFAPVGREVLSYWIGAVLLVFAGGAFGYHRIWAKSRVLSIGTEQHETKKRDA